MVLREILRAHALVAGQWICQQHSLMSALAIFKINALKAS
jgi:hypothetical protein